MADTPKVKIFFRQKPYDLRITCDGKSFNTSRIKDLDATIAYDSVEYTD